MIKTNFKKTSKHIKWYLTFMNTTNKRKRKVIKKD